MNVSVNNHAFKYTFMYFHVYKNTQFLYAICILVVILYVPVYSYINRGVDWLFLNCLDLHKHLIHLAYFNIFGIYFNTFGVYLVHEGI